MNVQPTAQFFDRVMRFPPPPEHNPGRNKAFGRIATISTELMPTGAVEALLGVKKAYFYRLSKQGKFPKPIKTAQGTFWNRDEVSKWKRDNGK